MATFSCEVFTEILRWLLLSELCSVRTVCKMFDGVVQLVLLQRTRQAVGPFIEDSTGFWKMLRRRQGAVTGHLPLWFFDPFTRWRPTVMTIVLPVGRRYGWQEYLNANGYVLA